MNHARDQTNPCLSLSHIYSAEVAPLSLLDVMMTSWLPQGLTCDYMQDDSGNQQDCIGFLGSSSIANECQNRSDILSVLEDVIRISEEDEVEPIDPVSRLHATESSLTLTSFGHFNNNDDQIPQFESNTKRKQLSTPKQ